MSNLKIGKDYNLLTDQMQPATLIQFDKRDAYFIGPDDETYGYGVTKPRDRPFAYRDKPVFRFSTKYAEQSFEEIK